MGIATSINLNRLISGDQGEYRFFALRSRLPERPRFAIENVTRNSQVRCRLWVIATLPRANKRDEIPQPEAGNRRLLKGNPKTRLLLRVGSLGAKPALPPVPVFSTVPLAAVSSVRMLFVHQSGSGESL
jgi:hypothetical protein